MNPFTRYRPIGAQPTGIFPPTDDSLPGGSLPDAFGSPSYAQDGDGSLSDGGPQYNAPEDFAFSDANSARPVQVPPVTPSMDVKSMQPTTALRPIAAQSSNDDDNGASAPPMPPPGLQGAPLPPQQSTTPAEATLGQFDATGKPTTPQTPQTPEDIALAKFLALKRPDKASYKGGKLRTVLGAIAGGLEGAAAGWNRNPNAGALGNNLRENIQNPGFAEATQNFDNRQADLVNQIKTADAVERIKSDAAARQENSEARVQNAVTNAQKQGIVFQLPGAKPPDGLIPTVNPLAGTAGSPYANATAYHDPNYGKFLIDGDLATTSGLKPGWYTQSVLDKAMEVSGKVPKETNVQVSPATAQQMHIAVPTGASTVDVPISTLNAFNTSQAKPPKAAPTATQIGLRRMGLPSDTNLDDLSPDQAKQLAQFSREDAQQFHVTTGNDGTWSIQEDADGKPVEYNSKTGQVRPVAAGGVQKSGTKEKHDAAQEKLIGPARDALQYATDYAAKGIPTGPGDEALMEKFFELAKPSTGFRMSQPQIDMLKNAQGWMNGIEAKLHHLTTGTWFSDKLRSQIVGTMQDIANAKMKAQQPGQAAASGATGAQSLMERHGLK